MKTLPIVLSIILILSSTVAYSQTVGHLVPIVELASALAAKTAEREAHTTEIKSLLQQAAVQEHLGGLLDLDNVERAAASLDDATLKDLGSRSRQINAKIAAAGATKGILITAAVVIGAYLTLVLLMSDRSN